MIFQGCLITRYCGDQCRGQAWLEEHGARCGELAAGVLGDSVFAVSAPEVLYQGEVAKVAEMDKEIGERAMEIKKKEAEIGALEEEATELKEEVKALKAAKAGGRSRIAALLRKLQEKEVETAGVGVQTTVTVRREEYVMTVAAASEEFGSLELVRGKALGEQLDGARTYSSPLLIKLPSSRVLGVAEVVAHRTVERRAHLAMDFLRLVSFGTEQHAVIH